MPRPRRMPRARQASVCHGLYSHGKTSARCSLFQWHILLCVNPVARLIFQLSPFFCSTSFQNCHMPQRHAGDGALGLLMMLCCCQRLGQVGTVSMQGATRDAPAALCTEQSMVTRTSACQAIGVTADQQIASGLSQMPEMQGQLMPPLL